MIDTNLEGFNTEPSVIKSLEAPIIEIQRTLENYGQNVIKKRGGHINVTVHPKVKNMMLFSQNHKTIPGHRNHQ